MKCATKRKSSHHTSAHLAHQITSNGISRSHKYTHNSLHAHNLECYYCTRSVRQVVCVALIARHTSRSLSVCTQRVLILAITIELRARVRCSAAESQHTRASSNRSEFNLRLPETRIKHTDRAHESDLEPRFIDMQITNQS